MRLSVLVIHPGLAFGPADEDRVAHVLLIVMIVKLSTRTRNSGFHSVALLFMNETTWDVARLALAKS